MFGKALAILFLDAAAVLAVGLWLRGTDVALGDGLLWGLAGGLFAALTAVGAAYWAESKGKTVQEALAVVVVGMLLRMFFLGGWTLLAVLVGKVHPFAFVGGFGALYLVGQALEVWILLRLRGRQNASARPLPSSSGV